jgi:TonB family protein
MRLAAATAAAAAILAAAPAFAQDVPDCDQPGTSVVAPANDHAMTSESYPLLSVALGEEGDVTLSLVIGPDGRVSDAKIAHSSGSLRLDAAALAAAKTNWRYVPARRDGKAIACRWTSTVQWRLNEGPFGSLDDMAANTIKLGADDYPASAKAAHEEGVVLVVVVMRSDGAVDRLILLRPSGFPDLDTAAMERARALHPAPASIAGKPMRSSIPILFVWTLGP